MVVKWVLSLLLVLILSQPARAQGVWPGLTSADLPPGRWLEHILPAGNMDVCEGDVLCAARMAALGRVDGQVHIFQDISNPDRVMVVSEIEYYDTPQNALQALWADCGMFHSLKHMVGLPQLGSGARLCVLYPSYEDGGYYRLWVSFAKGNVHAGVYTWGEAWSEQLGEELVIELALKVYKRIYREAYHGIES